MMNYVYKKQKLDKNVMLIFYVEKTVVTESLFRDGITFEK
jgi:hypothetical protein